MSPDIKSSIACGIGYFAGAVINIWLQRRQFVPQISELNAANTELRDRLATVTGQLADARARLDMRIQRAHEGACKAAKTRYAKRIVLPVAQAEGVRT